MKSYLYHLQFNIDFAKNLKFYKDFFLYLSWTIKYEDPELIGFSDGNSVDIWFVDTKNNKKQNYDQIGFNHFCIRVETSKNIDKISEFLKSSKVKLLFGTPKHRSEFANSNSETYYQIMFKTPDEILVEVVYIGEISVE